MKMTLRDAFWFVLVAAVGLAWWVDHRQQSIQLDRCEQLADRTFSGFLLHDLEDFFEAEGYHFRWMEGGALEIDSRSTDGFMFRSPAREWLPGHGP